MKSKFKDNFINLPILITGHVNPDGDAIGSALALKLLLDSMQIDSTVSFDITGDLPSNLNHLPYDLITTPEVDSFDTVFVFDCGNSSRLGDLEEIVLNSSKVVVVDHHIDPTFGDIQIIDPKAASTTQVLYRIFKEEELPISKEIADCLMTGLITDTGRFQYSNTNAEVFAIASDLMDRGSQLSLISENIYGSIELNALKLQSEIINRLILDTDLKFIYSVVYQEDYEKFNTTPAETDSLIDVVRLAKESEIALLLKEQIDGSFKGSLRSRTEFNVQQLASFFNGGGHKAASGFSSDSTVDDIILNIKNEIRKQI
ncbi:bifunctional oligoribonuclease/PAP phosphatase NrnA [Acidimicrobiia bacterium]|jgi:phosphoesterase RecJ-like protein|nr:bifunctional oligoribonuclease/PAP phosphatase NrnA [Acidimicrobiia bacterium]MDA7594769.1 bifunctional oligoribonuclease/PAP phosphatase NrnA [Acidimicrobiia bacterium]MDB3866252.1 bifunctional oligoribonuclease/PAP phosphatase NrnA [Acidimicrobiia bacterium]MDB4833564.1 bifunctional oligoribonuclease/PAP phosphatase NrnA [Acidimicrobiia bacterium]MDC0606879.1 bifunctional oligoribonuclease/PAP phosphatase NrnA [Acidimicrobiia bacterium]